MIEFSTADCRLAPKPHQIIAIKRFLKLGAYANFDQVGCGKTLPVVVSNCILWRNDTRHALVVVAPTPARSVWADPDPVLGEFTKHALPGVPYQLVEYCRRSPKLPPIDLKTLQVIVTNYEFIRSADRLKPLLDWMKARQRVFVAFDESWKVKNHTAQQYKACQKISDLAWKTTVLNGTPGDPKDVFNQFYLLNPSIVGYKNFWQFRGRHAEMGGYMNKTIVGWHTLDAFNTKIAPYFQQHKTRECFDLGDPPGRQTIEVPLTPALWALYTQMRDDLVAWINSDEASVARQAGTRVMRLAQLTCGFLGGVESPTNVLWTPPINDVARDVGREKLDALIEFLNTGWPDDDPKKLVVFTRFRPDVERTAVALADRYPAIPVYRIYGSQDPAEREAAKRALAPGGDPGPAIVVANSQSGGASLNFASSNLCVYLSNDYSLVTRLQSEGRVDRPGQSRWLRYVDFVATGPDGQRTVDHGVLKSLLKKQDLADQTLPKQKWLDVLKGD